MLRQQLLTERRRGRLKAKQLPSVNTALFCTTVLAQARAAAAANCAKAMGWVTPGAALSQRAHGHGGSPIQVT